MANFSCLGVLDWGVIGLYIFLTLGIAVWTKLRSKSTADEYLMAGRSMNWIVVAIAVFATLFSTISFVSVPGEAYNNGLVFVVLAVFHILMYPLAIWLFLRFFFLAPTFTAYEYLEKRFSLSCRMIGSLMFIVIRLFYAASVFYSAAVIFESLVGWHPLVTISVIGLITLIYTVTGGIKAVIFADVIQSVIIVVGIVAILFRVLQCCGFEIGEVFSFASRNNHTFEMFTKPEFYRLNVHDRWNFWLLIPAIVMTPMVSFSCDQLVVQRLLTSKGFKQAKRSVYMNYFMGMPVVVMLYAIGIFLFFYYNSGAKQLPAGINGDQVLGYFINTELVAPLPGIIVAALLSALMSTIAGVVNSLATVFYKDIIVRFKPELSGGKKEMSYCYWLSILAGVISVMIAVFMYISGNGLRTSLLEVVGIWSNLWGILFIAFFYGVLSKRVSSRSIIVTLIICGVINLLFPYVMYYLVAPENRWGFSWVGIPGQLLAFALPPLLSLIWPEKKNLKDLTVWTLDKNDVK